MNRILKEREKFIKHLNQKLQNLKIDEATPQVVKKNWKEILKENLHKITTLSLNQKSQIVKIIQKDTLNEEDKREFVSVLKKLPIEDLISLLGKDFEKHSKNYVKWGWDFYEYIKEDMLTSYIKKNESILFLEKNVSVETQNDKRTDYSTLQFIDNLIREITNIAPSDLVRISGKSAGKISLTWVSKNIFKRPGGYLSKVRQWILNPNNDNYNPEFKFALSDLDTVMESLKYYAREWRESIKECCVIFDLYSLLNNLKQVPNQQFHIYNPNLNFRFFSNINDRVNNKKTNYWLGFLCADGYTQKGYSLGITLSRKDRDQLIRFCQDIGLNPSQKVKNFERELNGKIYEQSRVTFGCKPMIINLLELNYKEVPEFIKNSRDASNDSDALAWLFGLYDGDGQQGKTSIYSTKRQLLEQIRTSFNVPNEVYKAKDPRIALDVYGYPKLDSHGDPVLTKTLYVLRLGPSLFNKIMDNYRDSMPRKRKYFDERIDAAIKLKRLFSNKRELLQGLVDQLPTTQIMLILQKTIGVSRNALYNLIDEWNIVLPPVGYWNTKEGKSKKQFPQWFIDTVGYIGEI